MKKKVLLGTLVIAFGCFVSCKKKNDDECPKCPSVTSVSPVSGRAYTTLTINGINFNSDFRSNIVKINGVSIEADSILSGTTTQLTVKVPKGCGTGRVTVDVDADLTNTGTPPVFQYIFTYQVTTLAGLANTAGSGGTTLGTIRFTNPYDLICAPSNILYIKDQSFHTLRYINLTDNTVGNIDGGGCGSSGALSLDFDGNTFYYSSDADEVIYAIAGSNCSVLAGNFSNSLVDSTLLESEFNSPTDVAINQSNSAELFVADFANHCVRKISLTTGRVTTFAGGPGLYGDEDGPLSTAKWSNPISVLAKGGIVYVADEISHKVKKIQNGIVSDAGRRITRRRRRNRNTGIVSICHTA